MTTDARTKDGITNAIKVIDYEHHETHGGSSFKINHGSLSLASGSSISISFTTPNTAEKWVHIIAFFSSSGTAEHYMLEAPTITNGSGTQINPRNRNRNSIKTSAVLSIEATPVENEVTLDATITADGLILDENPIGGSGPKIGGANRGTLEWILASNTTYSFRLTSRVVSNVVAIELVWYEHTNVEEQAV